MSGAPPQWRRDGKELCYVTPNGQLTAVAVNLSGPSFEQGIPAPLFATAPDFCDAPNRYAVSRDGNRFLVNTAVEGTSTQPLEVVLNLTEELSRH